MDLINLQKGDCLELMKDIPDKSIDMILCDLPYGVTRNKWDNVLPFNLLWEQYHRVIKENGAIVLNCQQPFTTKLIASNIKEFRYCWIWRKKQKTGFLHAKKQPLRNCEDIAVFYQKQPTYNPEMKKGKNHQIKGSSRASANYGGNYHTITPYYSDLYYPTTLLEIPSQRVRNGHPTQKPVALWAHCKMNVQP